MKLLLLILCGLVAGCNNVAPGKESLKHRPSFKAVGSCTNFNRVEWFSVNSFADTTTCLFAIENDVIFSKTYIDTAFGRMGVYASLHARKRKKFLVWLHGGPRENAEISPSPFDLFLIGIGYNIVRPQYMGSANTAITKNGFKNAASQVSDLIVHLHNRFPGSQVSLVGESFGGYLAAKVATQRPIPCIVLIDPMIADFEDSYSFRNYRSFKVSLPKGVWESKGTAILLDTKRWSEIYFGQDIHNDLLSFITKKGSASRVIVITHDRDTVISTDQKARIANLARNDPSITYLNENDGGHLASLSNTKSGLSLSKILSGCN